MIPGPERLLDEPHRILAWMHVGRGHIIAVFIPLGL